MATMMMAFVFAAGLFVGILVMVETGRRIAARRVVEDPKGARLGTGAVEAAVFALLGLIIAFTFSGAATRFDARRDLIVAETNAIGTAYLRLDLLAPEARMRLREAFRNYVDARLAIYQKGARRPSEVAEELTRAAALQRELWSQALAESQAAGASPDAGKLLLPALNEMFDITTTRTFAIQMHPPAVIWAMLFTLALASALLAGYGMGGARSRSWLHVLGYAVIVALAVYVIIDIEYPRLGLIRVDTLDQALIDLRKGMT